MPATVPLLFLHSLQKPNQHLMKLCLFLQPYHLDISHPKGSDGWWPVSSLALQYIMCLFGFFFSSVSGFSSLQSLRHAFLGRGELAWVQMVTKVTLVVNAFCQWWWLKGWLVAVLPSAGQSLPWTLSCRSCSPGVDLRKPSQLPVIRGLIAACSIKGPGLTTFSLSSPLLHVTDRLLG